MLQGGGGILGNISDREVGRPFLGLKIVNTVEPPVSRHPRDQKKRPFKIGVRLWEVKNVVCVCM